MIHYIYDGSFEGMLTAIHEAYYRPEKPQRILREGPKQQNIFVTPIAIVTDSQKADKVYGAIKEKISHRALKNVFYGFLSEEEEVATWIYQYLQLGFKLGGKVDGYHTEERVAKLHKVSQKVGKEAHRMLGLIRFQKLEGGIYYASIEPDHNITALVAPHFANRMADQNWVIHDEKRNIAALYNQKEWIIREGEMGEELALHGEELAYQELWRKYFKAIAIKNRSNPRLQKSYMPKRYWKHLIELNK
ncbi:TIGR03915 family putative DNA repair protein [Natronincola ferrireducens]|uniref:Probable DNA metabolism protein n=1 Tax=Natronincola ferrireducens TaxID=393762 RepID=A0A1G8X9Y4_9FIRM|nr:TIGR03915 family putative DNA repair protein [Natronincola ferrireducens]SDJ87116.1 probable DNA metabolism protein [Natronincola ferrireducens]